MNNKKTQNSSSLGNKKDLINTLSEVLNVSKEQSNNIVNQFFNCINLLLIKHRKLTVSGWGSWLVAQKEARTYRQPLSDKIIKKPATQVVKFKVGKILKKMIAEAK